MAFLKYLIMICNAKGSFQHIEEASAPFSSGGTQRVSSACQDVPHMKERAGLKLSNSFKGIHKFQIDSIVSQSYFKETSWTF